MSLSLPTRNSRFAGLLPNSEVILWVEIAETPEKRAFRGVCPHPVSEIAAQCGYRYPANFRSAFITATGLNPLAWRKNNVKNA